MAIKFKYYEKHYWDNLGNFTHYAMIEKSLDDVYSRFSSIPELDGSTQSLANEVAGKFWKKAKKQKRYPV